MPKDLKTTELFTQIPTNYEDKLIAETINTETSHIMLNLLEKWEHLPKKLSGWLVIPPHEAFRYVFLFQGNAEYIFTHSNWATLDCTTIVNKFHLGCSQESCIEYEEKPIS